MSTGPGVDRPTGPAALHTALRLIDTWPVEHAAAVVIDASGVVARHGDTSHEFALASLTKPVVATAILVAVEEGIVTLDDAVDDRGATLRHLLAHAAGYPFDGRAPVAAPAVRRIYSNTGIELAAGLVETAAGMPFVTYLDEAVIAPLGLGMELRGSPAHGAHGSVEGFVNFAGELLRPALLAAETATDMRTAQYPSLDGVVPAVGSFHPCPWGLGVEIKGAKHPHWTADACSPATFGHFGGAGTFCWVDPAADLALVAFTDRSFIEWRDEAMHLWPALGGAVLGAAGAERAVTRGGDGA